MKRKRKERKKRKEKKKRREKKRKEKERKEEKRKEKKRKEKKRKEKKRKKEKRKKEKRKKRKKEKKKKKKKKKKRKKKKKKEKEKKEGKIQKPKIIGSSMILDVSQQTPLTRSPSSHGLLETRGAKLIERWLTTIGPARPALADRVRNGRHQSSALRRRPSRSPALGGSRPQGADLLVGLRCRSAPPPASGPSHPGC